MSLHINLHALPAFAIFSRIYLSFFVLFFFHRSPRKGITIILTALSFFYTYFCFSYTIPMTVNWLQTCVRRPSLVRYDLRRRVVAASFISSDGSRGKNWYTVYFDRRELLSSKHRLTHLGTRNPAKFEQNSYANVTTQLNISYRSIPTEIVPVKSPGKVSKISTWFNY